MGRLYRKTFKNPIYILGILLIGLIILFSIIIINYNNNLKKVGEQALFQQEQFISLIPNNSINNSEAVEEASSTFSKSINEVIEETTQEENKTEETSSSMEVNASANNIQEEIKKELSFEYPVEGEIVKDFARDTLLYSETLKEWTVHNGIDIKAERTTVVKAAEEGKIIAINNDPRYGLTVIIEHQDGFKTVYSNLLTSEFVKENEEVKKGQSIGTVGNSAAFEIADEPHLHFEILLNNEYVDPKIYLK